MASGDASRESAEAGAWEPRGSGGEVESVDEGQGGDPSQRLKLLFGYGNVHYRGVAKNMKRLALLFGLGNRLTAEGQLAA